MSMCFKFIELAMARQVLEGCQCILQIRKALDILYRCRVPCMFFTSVENGRDGETKRRKLKQADGLIETVCLSLLKDTSMHTIITVIQRSKAKPPKTCE